MKGIPSTEAMEMLIQRVKKTKSNAEFLVSLKSLIFFQPQPQPRSIGVTSADDFVIQLLQDKGIVPADALASARGQVKPETRRTGWTRRRWRYCSRTTW